MTSALNRKFDLLCRSGTCPAYLMDVLSLLVAHTNDTELFKSECRQADADASCFRPPAQEVASRHAVAEKSAAERRLALIREQAEDPEELDAAIRASHETVLLAAEHSLRSYAENLKHANDIALAAAEKQLCALRVETRAELERFKKLALESTVEETRSELDLLRADWFTDTRKEVENLRASIHEVGIAAQAEVFDLTNAYTRFVVNTQDAMCYAPLTDAHRNAGASLVMEEQVDTVLRTMANQGDLTALEERVRQLEKSLVLLAVRGGEAVGSDGGGGTGAPARAVVASASPAADGEDEVRAVASDERPAGQSYSASAPHRVASSTAGETARGRPAGGAAAVVAPSAVDRIGLTLQQGRNGLCVTHVASPSQAVEKGISIGSIVSHVGRTHVTTTEAYAQAVEEAAAVENASVKLTIYDPQLARVRVVVFSL